MKKAKKGFTLVELMVVIVIMAVLAAAATPVFAGYVKRPGRQSICLNAGPFMWQPSPVWRRLF